MANYYYKFWVKPAVLIIGIILCQPVLRADVRFATLFSDHLVLQRAMQNPVWGWADPGEAVTVSFAGQIRHTIADSSGKWTVRLPKMAADAVPQVLTAAGKNTVTVHDVVVGDVWLCAGQSNMEYRLAWDSTNAAAVPTTTDPGLRCFFVDYHTAPSPDADFQGSPYQVWMPATPDNVIQFSAVGYYFARALREALGPSVPIGFICDAYGGVPAEPWVSRQGLSRDPELDQMATAQIANMVSYPQNLQKFQALVSTWESTYRAGDCGNTGEALGWSKYDFDDSAWSATELPVNFSHIGMKSGGAAWVRKIVIIPSSLANKSFDLRLNYSSDSYTVYFNGVRLATNPSELPLYFNESHGYQIPANLVHAGPNTFAIRIFSHTNNGGLSIRTADLPFSLGSDTTWRYHIEFENPPLPAGADAAYPAQPHATLQYTATYIYNAMISPLIPSGIKGVVWYQGESNASRGYQYRKLLPALIADWRSQWGEGQFPFYIVQLAAFGATSAVPQDTDWSELREAQFLTAETVPSSGLAVTIDIGDANNIHPVDKIDVGKRLALIALAKTYGRDIEYSGPWYRSYKVEDSAVRVSFAHTTGGLEAKDGGPLKQFEIAGSDQNFVWADAVIDGDSVVVSSPTVTKPVAVRYAFADNPDGCNLYNGAGLPASPFRTDNWPGVTFNNH